MQVVGTVVAVRWLRLRVEGQKMPHHKKPMQNRQNGFQRITFESGLPQLVSVSIEPNSLDILQIHHNCLCPRS
jgi:hypothetical protein